MYNLSPWPKMFQSKIILHHDNFSSVKKTKELYVHVEWGPAWKGTVVWGYRALICMIKVYYTDLLRVNVQYLVMVAIVYYVKCTIPCYFFYFNSTFINTSLLVI